MSYLHCHTKGCGWSQDDFWNWKFTLKFWKWNSRPFGYNPLSLIIEDVKMFSYPRFIKCENKKQFSWFVMLSLIKRHIKRLFTQKWWTYESFKRDVKAVCPKCGKKCFDID